jgi:hypothetical protein
MKYMVANWVRTGGGNKSEHNNLVRNCLGKKLLVIPEVEMNE